MPPTKNAREIATPWRTAACTLPRHENEFPLTGFSAINQLNRPPVQGVANEASASERDVLMIGSFDDGGVRVSHRLLPSVRPMFASDLRECGELIYNSPRPFLYVYIALYIKINHARVRIVYQSEPRARYREKNFSNSEPTMYCLPI